MEVGINIQSEKVDMLRFADDIAMLAESEEDLQSILPIMNTKFKDKYDIKIKK